jgi:hypothetical protein
MQCSFSLVLRWLAIAEKLLLTGVREEIVHELFTGLHIPFSGGRVLAGSFDGYVYIASRDERGSSPIDRPRDDMELRQIAAVRVARGPVILDKPVQTPTALYTGERSAIGAIAHGVGSNPDLARSLR